MKRNRRGRRSTAVALWLVDSLPRRSSSPHPNPKDFPSTVYWLAIEINMVQLKSLLSYKEIVTEISNNNRICICFCISQVQTCRSIFAIENYFFYEFHLVEKKGVIWNILHYTLLHVNLMGFQGQHSLSFLFLLGLQLFCVCFSMIALQKYD